MRYFILSILTATMTLADVIKLDFGTSSSAVMDGFTRVTDGDAMLSSTNTLSDFSRSGVPDNLAGDGVYALKGNWSINIPITTNGAYRVWILTGDSLGVNEIAHLAQNLFVVAEGSIVITNAQRDPYYAQDFEFDRSADIWQRHAGTNRFWELTFDVTVSDNELNLYVGSTHAKTDYAFPVNAIVAYPVSAAQTMAEDLAAITQDRRRQWALRFVGLDEPRWTGPEWSLKPPEDGKYDVWWVPYWERIYSTTLPVDKTPVTETFATPGEWEPLTFAIRSPFDLGEVTVSASDLRSADGDEIDSSNVHLHYTSLITTVQPSGTWLPGTPYAVHPLTSLTIQSNVTRQIWADIYTPTNTPAGRYTGTITVTPETGDTVHLAYEFTVMPFSLQRSTNASWFYFGYPMEQWFRMHQTKAWYNEEEYWNLYRLSASNLVEHGFVPVPHVRVLTSGAYESDAHPTIDASTNLTSMNWSRGKIRWDFLKTNNFLPQDGYVYVQSIDYGAIFCGQSYVGGYTWPDNVSYSNLFCQITLAIDEWIKTNGYGTPVFEWGGEFTNFGDSDTTAGLNAYSALKSCGVLTSLRANGARDMTIIESGNVDFAIPNIALMSDQETDDIKAVEEVQDLWAYNFDSGRYGFGFFAQKKGITRRFHEGYINNSGVSVDKFDGDRNEWEVGAEAVRDGVVPRLAMKWMREGRDDYDYWETARYWTGQVAVASQAFNYATNVMQTIWDALVTDIQYGGDPADPGRVSEAVNLADLQGYRQMLATAICGLVHEYQQPYQKDLTFYASFDGSTTADFSLGVSAALDSTGINYVTGHDGIGLAANMPNGYIKYSATNNVNAKAGTLMFWFLPHWTAPSATLRYWYSQNDPAGNPSTNAITLRNNATTSTIRGLYSPQFSGSTIDIVDYAQTWGTNEWKHIAFTWQFPDLKIYLDGVLVARDDLKTTLSDPHGEFVFGAYASGANPGNGVYDELRIYGREMTAQEIGVISGLKTSISLVSAAPLQSYYPSQIKFVPYSVKVSGPVKPSHKLRLTVGSFLPVDVSVAENPVFQMLEAIPPGTYTATLALLDGESTVDSKQATLVCVARPALDMSLQRTLKRLDQARPAISDSINAVNSNIGTITRP